MSKIVGRDTLPAPGPAHELALVERRLRMTDGVTAVVVNASQNSARLYFDSWSPNESTRGDAKAHVCQEIAASRHWELVTIHDDIEDDDGTMHAAITLARSETRESGQLDNRVDSLTVTYRGQSARRRVRYVPQGQECERIVEEWNGCRFRPVGREVVDELNIERGGEVIR